MPLLLSLRPHGTVILVILALMLYLVYHSHPLFSVPTRNMTFVMHVSQATHTRLPFCSSSHHAEHPFDLIHLDLWTSPVVSVSDSKYYLIILDDFTHYLWTFPLKLKSDTFPTLSNFFVYVSTQSGRTVKTIQCDNGR
jgi:hypothetical protein